MSQKDKYNSPTYQSEPWRLRDADWEGRNDQQRKVLFDSMHKGARDRHYIATHDSLTDALNRNGLSEFLEDADVPKAVILIDATRFKQINDVYSHARGDEVIQETYNILARSTRGNDVIARVGGDEFVIILNVDEEAGVPADLEENRREHTPTNAELIEIIAKRIEKETKDFLDKNPDLKAIKFDIAVGGVEWRENKSVGELINEAEEAMKIHKGEQHEEGGKYR